MFAGFEGKTRIVRHMRRKFRGGWGGFEGPEWGSPPRMRRGDIKYLLLEALAERPMHGYDIMRELEERHEGRYRPSAGSVYPTLQMLEDGGFLKSETVDGKRVYSITDAGQRMLDERGEVAGEEPEETSGWRDIRAAAKGLAIAVHQGLSNEDPEIRKRVLATIDNTRKAIYKILAGEG